MASDLSKLKILEKSHVKPKKKLGKKECQLVTFDLPYLAFYYNQKLLFYKGDDFEGMVKKLKEGLSVVLEEFISSSGSLRRMKKGFSELSMTTETTEEKTVVVPPAVWRLLKLKLMFQWRI